MTISYKNQGGKWLFLNYWGKTVKMTKSQGAKWKFTQTLNMKAYQFLSFM
ncbi:hypothetical protein Hanom_Chr03g00272901 [Helianthus anomalus]